METADLDSLKTAKELLESPGLTTRVAALIGVPIEKGLSLLPEKAQSAIQKAAEKSIHVAYDLAMKTLPEQNNNHLSQNLSHKLAVAGTGGFGGLFGPTALFVELPISTTLMMRSIIDIAQSEGENINDPETKLACLEVFAFSGFSVSEEAAGSGYILTRAALANAFTNASKSFVGKTLSTDGAPMLARLLAKIAGRFQLVVADKVAAQMLPVVGALGGAAINVIFMDHFQDMARGHFVVRRLEKKYGTQTVHDEYEKISIH